MKPQDNPVDQELITPFHEIPSSDHFQENNILDLLPVAICVCDMSGLIKKYNEQAVNLWGRRPNPGDKDECFCGSYKLYNPDGSYLPHDQTPVAVCLGDGLPRKDQELIIEKPDHTRIHVRVNIVPVKDSQGRQTGVINCFYNITGQLAVSREKKMEEKIMDLQRKNEALKRSEERYHKMVEEVEDYAIILLDRNGIIQNWNKGAEKIKGYTKKEIIGKSFQEFYLPKDREKQLPGKLIEEAMAKGKAEYEGWRVRKNGDTFWGSIVLTALRDDENNIIGFSKVTHDLTKRKLAEDKLEEYASQLKFQNQQLEEFTYAASHDMKEPLRKILFYNNHLLETAGDKLDEKEKEYLNRSLNAAKRMSGLIDDLLEYSKATSESKNFQPVALKEVIDEISLEHKEMIEQSRAVIHFSSLPVIKAIPFQLRQLFDNLIINALKYHHPGRTPEITIDAEETTGKDITELDAEKIYYRISVQDNGIGFEDEYSEKIFELFQRLGPAKYSGTGVGLALCKKIVQNHHGTIKASGRVDEGACFKIYLPA